MIISRGTIFQLGVLLLSLLVPEGRSSFVRAPRPIQGGDHVREAQTRYRDTYQLYLNPDNKEPDENPVDLKNFNPFQQQKQRSRSSARRSSYTSASSSSPNIISLRQTQMQQLMSEMLEAVNKGDDGMKQVLETHKEFLLEPLEDDEAVLDVDSIYTPQMTRQERYQAYKKEMQKRIERASDPNAKSVLQNMLEFVLSHE
jgi:hypothetical protein